MTSHVLGGLALVLLGLACAGAIRATIRAEAADRRVAQVRGQRDDALELVDVMLSFGVQHVEPGEDWRGRADAIRARHP